MPGANTTTVNGILKEVYEGRIENQLNEETNATARLEKSSDGITETVGGKYVTFPVRVARNAGISYRDEDSQLANAGQQGYAAVQVKLKYGYGRFRLTGQVMSLAETNYQAFASAMDEEMGRLKDDLAKDSNRIAYGDPTSNGALAFINDTATSATHAVVSAQNLLPAMIVDVLVASTGSATGGGTALTINSVDYVNNTVTFNSSIGATTTGHAVYRTGNRAKEPEGYSSIIASTGLLHGLDPATQPIWAAVYNTAGGNRPLSESLMIRVCDDVRRNGGKVSAILTSLGVRRSYFALLTQQRRYTNTKDFGGGFQGLPFNYGKEIPVVEDVDAPVSKMWFIDESKMKVYQTKGWHFADDDGDTIKWVQDFDAWQGFMRRYWQIGVTQRNANGLMDKITEG